jgi:four helix bundle protein
MALQLCGEVSEMTKTFPKDKLFVLTSQVKRAADSVVLNIAEGSTLQSNVEFRRFLVIANRSALEVVSCFYLAKQRGFINDVVFEEKYKKYEKLIAMIQALIKSLGNE